MKMKMKFDKNEFIVLARLDQNSLLNYIKNILYDYKYDVNKTNDYLIAKGDIPICLIAHADTVFNWLPSDIYHDKTKNVLWSPQGLGADDRAGIFAILNIIDIMNEIGYGRPHVIITTGEEYGGIGAYSLISDHDCPPFDIKFMIELDRQGSDDCVFYNCDNKDFIKTIEEYGFKEQEGTFSDISIIAPAWGAAAVNLSVGYYQEHTNAEYLKMEELNACVWKVISILKDYEELPSFSYIPKKNEFYYNKDDFFPCYCCGMPIKEKKIRTKYYKGSNIPVCSKCSKLYYWDF